MSIGARHNGGRRRLRGVAVEEAAGGLSNRIRGWEMENQAWETAEGLMAQETEAAIRQASRARCKELGAQCKDTAAAVEARAIAEAQAEFEQVYAELQARCKAESEAAVDSEARIDEAKAELRLEFERARAEFEARYKAEAEAHIAEVQIEARAEAMRDLGKVVLADLEKAAQRGKQCRGTGTDAESGPLLDELDKLISSSR